MDQHKLFIGINIGTSKIVLTAASAEKILDNRQLALDSQGDVTEWETKLVQGLSSFRQLGSRATISICGTSGSFVLVDEFGRPIGTPSLYNDEITAEELERVNFAVQPFGVRLSASDALARLHGKILDLRPDQRNRVAWLVPQSIYLLFYLLLGHDRRWVGLSTDLSNARKLGANAEAKRWPLDVYQAIGMPEEVLPKLVSAGEEVGLLRNRHGFDEIQLVHGTTDASAECMALIGNRSGCLGITVGSTTSMKGAIAGKGDISRFAYFSNHPLSSQVILYNAWASTGENIRKIAVSEGLTVGDLVRQSWEFDLSAMPAEIVPIGQTPFVENGRQPEPQRLCRQVMESTACWEAYHVKQFKSLLPGDISDIGIVGGTAQSAPWVQARADCFGYPISVYRASAAIGTLIPAMIHQKLVSSADEFCARYVEKSATFDPRTPDRRIRRLQEKMDAWIESHNSAG